MSKRIKIGSEFISMNKPKDAPHLTNIYFGATDGTGSHAHLVASGSIIVEGLVSAETWYARDSNNNELIKNGSELTKNTSQLLSDCIPVPLKELQHPSQPLFWNAGSLGSFFSSLKKHLQPKL